MMWLTHALGLLIQVMQPSIIPRLVQANSYVIHWCCGIQLCKYYIKNFDSFTRTSVCVSKMNDVARIQLTFQMFTLLKK